jgi:hypothetical protein
MQRPRILTHEELKALENRGHSADCSPARGSVWLVLWDDQRRNASGVSAVMSDEKRAQDYAIKCNLNTTGVMFHAENWLIL